MYTSVIGKKFLRIYNRRTSSEYSAEKFFHEVFFRLFFNDASHLMHVANSPFFQKPKPADVAKHGSVALAQLANLAYNIRNDVPNMSVFVGGSSKDPGGVTSGQVSNIPIQIDAEEMYASWIGQGLSIGVNGGFALLMEIEEILWAIYEGWSVYRKYLDETPGLKEKQIETWNGQWVRHYFSPQYDKKKPYFGITPSPEYVQGKLAITTVRWSTVIMTLANRFPGCNMIAYAYNLSQTNTTLGFIPLNLKEIHTLFDVCHELYDGILPLTQFMQWESSYNLKEACALGTIRLKAMEPFGLRAYMPRGSAPYAQGKDFSTSNDDSPKNYHLYKIWLYAMLKKQEIIQMTEELAGLLVAHENGRPGLNKSKANRSQEVKKIIESRYFKEFAANIPPLLSEENCLRVEEIVQKCYLEIPTDHFPLFLTLVRLKYQVQQNARIAA